MSPRQYKALTCVRFGPGDVLGLSAAQVARRAGKLQPTDGGLYSVLAAVEFKAGEVIGLVGDLPKRLLPALAPVAPAAAPPGRKAAPKQPAPAAAD